jgi:hypothetical protein
LRERRRQAKNGTSPGSTVVRQAIRPFVFAVCATIVVDLATDAPWQRGQWLGPFFQMTPATQATSACCAALLALLTALLLLRGSERVAGSIAITGAWTRILWILPIASMVFSFLWTRVQVETYLAIPWNAMVVAAPLFVFGFALKRWPPVYIAGLVAIVGIAVRLVHFTHFSIDEGADMLPLTRAAIVNVLAGKNPYIYYNLPDPVPLTYLPLTWLAYLPPYLAHIDLRWTNVACEVAILAAFVIAGPRRETTVRPIGRAGSSVAVGDLALIAWSFQFLLPSSVYFDRITTAPVAWAMTSWCVVLSVRESPYSWAMLGLTAAATPMASILAPFLFVQGWKREGFRGAAARIVKAGLVTSLILAPFIMWSPRGFVEGTVLWFNDLARYPGTTWRAYQPWQRYVGFGGLFWREGLERLLRPIQWLLVGAIAALFVRRGATSKLLPSHVAAAFVLFMLFNSVHWPYFYQAAIYVAILAIATLDKDSGSEVASADASSTRSTLSRTGARVPMPAGRRPVVLVSRDSAYAVRFGDRDRGLDVGPRDSNGDPARQA